MHPMTTIRTGLRHAVGAAVRTCRSGPRALVLGALLVGASTATVLGTDNSAPELASVRLSAATAREGQTVNVIVAVGDADPDDSHTLLLYWEGGDSDNKQKVQLPAGQWLYEGSHTYADEVPTDHFKVVVYDHQLPVGANDNTTGGAKYDTQFVRFSVENVAPAFATSSVTVTKPGARRVVVEGDVTDPGTADTVAVSAAWGVQAPNAPTDCQMSNNSRHFRCEHTYPTLFGISRSYVIDLTAVDNDGGRGTHRTSVRIP
jgi:hypothetical protein